MDGGTIATVCAGDASNSARLAAQIGVPRRTP
jgi:hypothetical protein